MWFYMFMAAVTLLIPLAMLITGGRLGKKPPQEINLITGYRTRLSMMSVETWAFANVYFGRKWRIFGKYLLAATIVIMAVFGVIALNVGLFGGLRCSRRGYGFADFPHGKGIASEACA